jgi:hypothetical protein
MLTLPLAILNLRFGKRPAAFSRQFHGNEQRCITACDRRKLLYSVHFLANIIIVY